MLKYKLRVGKCDKKSTVYTALCGKKVGPVFSGAHDANMHSCIVFTETYTVVLFCGSFIFPQNNSQCAGRLFPVSSGDGDSRYGADAKIKSATMWNLGGLHSNVMNTPGPLFIVDVKEAPDEQVVRNIKVHTELIFELY
jgi:hypothetical protein